MNFKLTGDRAKSLLQYIEVASTWQIQRDQISELLGNLTPLGIKVTLEHAKPKHTDEQAGYYWMCLTMFAKHYGTSKDDMHNIILQEAFGSQEIVTAKNVYKIPAQRSSKLTRDEYGELIETLLRVAAFAGCTLPDPETVG